MTPSFISLLAEAPPAEGMMWRGVALMIVGMVVVFGALVSVGVLISALRMIGEIDWQQEASTASAPPAPAPVETESEGFGVVEPEREAPAPVEPASMEPEPVAPGSIEAGPTEPPPEAPAPAAPEPTEPTPVAPAAPAPAAREPAPAGIDSRTLAIIAAAATTVVGGQVRVRHVEFLRSQRGGGWAERGRVGIQTSHNLQMRNR